MQLESRSVSRKTPLDGKLEISERAASAIGLARGDLVVRLDGQSAGGYLSAMTCTCARGGSGGAHVHHFLESELFRSLLPDSRVALELSDDNTAVVSAARLD